MSGRPQGRVRQSRRERSQRSRGRDNSADSVSSTRSERERDSNRNSNGRNTRRRPERRDERSRKPDDKPPERDATRSGNTDKREDKGRRGEKPSTRERAEGRDAPRDLNRDYGKTSNSLDRHSTAANDSRLSTITKRIIRETDRERRVNAAKQLEEYFLSPENIQAILKNQDNVLVSLEDIMYERNLLVDVKDHLVQCLVTFAGMLGYDMKRFFQWIFNKLDSSSSDDVKTVLLTSLSKIIQNESCQQYFREIIVNVMSLLENILENVDSPDLLYAVLSVIMSVATDYPQAFAGYFRDTVDILVGWHIDISQQQSLTAHMSECLIQLHPYWASDIAFSLTLLGQFLEDMEAYAEELSMLANKQVSSEGVPSPYTSLPKLTALVRVLTTVVNGIGDFFSPAQTPAITIPYIEDIIQRVIQSICLSGFGFYYENLFIAGNDCLSSLCNWLQVYFTSSCDQTAIFITQQLQYCQKPTYPHLVSVLDLLDKVIKKVGTSLPITFIKAILSPGSHFMKLRLTPDEAILSNMMKIYQGFLGIRDVQLMEATYNITVAELTEKFIELKQMTKTGRDAEAESLPSDSVSTNDNAEGHSDDTGKTVNQPVTDKGDKEKTLRQPIRDGITDEPIKSEIVTKETVAGPITGNVVSKEEANLPISEVIVSMDTSNEPITTDMISMGASNEPFTNGKDHVVIAHQLQSIIIFDLCALSEIATEKSAIIGLWKLTPTLFELLTQNVSASEWTVAACYPAVQYTILHALYTHCQRNTHFLSSVKDPSINPDQYQKGSLSFVLNLLSKVLGSSSSSYDTRKLCLVWVMEILDLIFKSGPEITARVKNCFNFDILGNSLLPLTFNPCNYLSMEVCECMKILVELKLLSTNCLKRCLQDCTVRLMDVNEAVRDCYLSLIKALPADIITSFASRSLLQDRVKMQKTSSDYELSQLTTSCEDVWWVRKNHIIKPPSGTFQSYNFQVVMAFIQHGVMPSKEMQSDWLVRLFHTCNRPNKYTENELTHFNSSQSALWFWTTWETAQFCILSKLRTSLGRAQETFQAIEGSLNQYAKEAKAADQDDQAKPRNKDEKKSADEDNESTAFTKAYRSQLRTTLLLQFVENLEKLMYNAYDGCTVGMPPPPKSVRVFFRTNRSTCQEWLSRIRLPAIEVSHRCGSPAIAVWHGMQMLQEMKATEKLKGPEFEQAVLLLCKALCEVKSPQAIAGLKAWCAKNTDQEMPWINGIILKAKGWYENAAEEYKTSLNNCLPEMTGQADDSKVKNTVGLSPAAMEFLINEVADCYSKLSDWNEVEKWQKEITNSRKNIQEAEMQHAMHLNLDMNYIRALSKFEEGNFTATQNHLRLIPGNCLNAITDNVRKSTWSLHAQETEMTFNPLWDASKIHMAAELCLVQGGVLYGASTGPGNKNTIKDGKLIKAVKDCIHQSASLATGALHVGCLDWPPLVSPHTILQVQQATVMEDTIDAFTKGDLVPSILQGDGSFTADPTRHNCAVLNQALRFTSHIAQLTASLGKPKGSLTNELLTLQLETATLARKHENYSLAQRLLLKQLVKLGVVVQPDTDSNDQNNILGSLVRGLTSVSSVKGSSRLELLKAQRESAKLAYSLGHTQDAVGILSGSILEFTKVNESDDLLRELNSRSLVTLSKWLMNDRKLLTSATKTNSNVTPLVAKMSSLCDTEEEFLSYGHSTLIGSKDEEEATKLTLDDEMVWSGGVSSVGSGVDDMESVCGQLLHLSTMQTPDLGKAWYHLAAWCYRWGRKTVEQASSMGNVELVLEERDRALQSIPKGATDEQIDAVLSELGQAHSADSQTHDEDIGDDDQFYDNGMDITRKLLLQVCPSLQDADPSSLETLLSIWKGVRDRLFKHYHYAAKAYFMYLKIGNGHGIKEANSIDRNKKINKSNDDGNVTATLRLLRLLVKHAGELRSVLEEGLAHTPTTPWKDIIPQLFSRLNHPEAYVRQSVSELLCRVASDAPHLIVYPAVVGATGSMPQFLNKSKESEGLLPLLVANIQDKQSSQNGPQAVSMVTSDKPVKQDNEGSLESCYRTIVDSLQSVNPKLVSELQQFIQELRRITLLWEELWLGSLIQTHQDVLRRQQQLDEEIKRVNSNTTLNEQQKMTLIKEKHIAIMKPVVFALEQLQKITSHPPATPHEHWFNRTYNSMIENALQILRNPDNPSDPKASWEPFKQLVQTLQARSQKKSAYNLVMSAISPVLAKMKNTAIYMPGQTHFGGEIVTISSISNEVNILPTKTKPKKLVFIGSDGQRHTYLFKGLEDLHLDERIMQFLSICNNMFTRADSHRCPLFYSRHYSVTPLGPRSGLIQWVDGAVPLFALYKRWQQREAATTALLKSTQGNNQTPQPPMKPSELFYSKMTPALKEKGIKDPRESDRKEWPLSVMRSVLEELVKETPSDLLARELWCSSTGSLEWWHITKTYARSTAVMSMIGYIIGLGDRHLDNMLVDFTTGEVVHIDYNVCFEKGKGLRVPEKVPFRMTPNLETALGVTGVEGMFRLSCEQVLKILRQGRETLLTLLEAFVYDPLVDWTSANDNAFASAFYGGGAAGINDSKVNKKEMERGVTQSLFSSRVAEMKVNWTTNRDEMLAAIGAQEEVLNNYISSVKHLKSMDQMLEQLKEQQGTLQSAVNNTSHPLHSLQAKFDEHVKLKSNHDNVLQSIKSKLGECINWHSQHKVSMEMIHSPQFSILVADILKPLDIGVPSFAPAIKFLKDAGQGNIVSQCEQLETELESLLHQRRAMQKTCLDLIHTYATVTSQFPANYVNHNRMYEWMCWLKEIIHDSSTKMCQEVLKKSEETRVHTDKTADNPLSVAAMNSLMSMEVKLQTNLTDQNSKFIKFCERRKQESVETGFLSKAVDEALANLNKYVSDNHHSAATCLTAVIVKVLCSQCKRCLVMENTAKVAGDRLSELTSREGDWFLEELCSMSGNVTQLLSLVRSHTTVVEVQTTTLKEELNTSIKGVFAVHKVFTALQELMSNFRNIIVPEAIKSLTSGDPSVSQMLEKLDQLVHGEQDVATLAKTVEKEMIDNPDSQDVISTSISSKISILQQQFDAIQQSRNGIGKDSSERMTAGQMLLAGFNGLFTKVESELDSMDAALSQVNHCFGNKACDVIQDAKKLQEANRIGNSQLCSKLFFLRRLMVMAAFFKDCRELVENMKENPELQSISHKSNISRETVAQDQPQYKWNADKCYSEDELALHIRQFIAESVQKRILGLPSQAMGIVVYEYLNLLDVKMDNGDKNGPQSVEETCKKVIDMKIKKGVFQQKQFSQMSSLTSAYDVAWRKHDFARRLDHNINLYKGVVQRAQLQLARFQWLYEDDLLRCPLRGNNMISPAKASIMNDMRKRVQTLVQLEPAIKGVEEKITSQQSSIEQRLKWAAGANPALNPVLKEFDKTVNDKKQLLQLEAKHSSDICSLSNALIHFEMLHSQSHEVAALDSTITELVNQCKKSSSEFEKSLVKLKAMSEITSLLNIKCPPEAPITLGWMKNKLESVSQEISSHKSRKTQAVNAVTTKRESLKSHTNTLKALIMTHQQLVSDVKALLTTMAKDEDGYESSTAAKLFITSYNRLSEESGQLIKNMLTCGSWRIEGSDLKDDKVFDENMQDVKCLITSITSLIHWVHDHLLALASPLMPEDSVSNGGKTPIAAPPPTFASALQKGSTTTAKDIPETASSTYCAPTNPVILHKDLGIQSPAGGGSPTTRPTAVASPRKSSIAFLARDPKTGKALQQRNTYAISVWRKVKAKLDGRDFDQAKRMSVTDQVDHVIREATSLDNLSQMYEGWTAWV